MTAVTDRNPRVIGLAVIVITLVAVAAVLLLNRSIFERTYTVEARFSDSAGITPGTQVLVAGVDVGTVGSLHLSGGHVDADLEIDRGVVLPARTSAAISVQTLLGQLGVDLTPVSGWNHPLHGGSVLTDTSVPVELYDIQNEAGNLFTQSDAGALNAMIQSLATIAQGTQQQVAQIVNGLNGITGVVDQRTSEVSQLIDSANTLSTAVDQRDAQLSSSVSNLSTVVSGLAQHSTQLGDLIDNTQQAAQQIDTLVGTNQPQLQGLVSHLDSVLGVLSDHQLDLAQGVSSLASAVTGFSSVGYSGPQDTPNSWANIYTNLVGTSGVYSVLGACGALDDVLDEALGPDPLPCDERSGPLASDAAAPAASTSTATTPATSATPATTATTVPPTGTGAPAPAVDPVVPPATGTTPSAGGSSGSLGALLRPLLGGSG